MRITHGIRSYGWLILSIIFIGIAEGRYLQSEFNKDTFLFILFSIFFGGIYFFQKEILQIKSIKKDCMWIVLLLFIVAPIYLYHFDSIPLQINTDEIAIMNTSKAVTQQFNVDILGVNDYLGFATFIFYIFGKLATWFGNIDLYHYRFVHTLSGILISVAAFEFFKQLVGKHWQAFGLALWLSSNHALFAISRMAMRDNTGLLIELVCLTCLMIGWKKKYPFWLFIGGIMGGLSFYTYFPSRVTILIWLLFAITSILFLCEHFTLKEGLKKICISLFGFFLIVPFIFISSVRHPDLAFHYSRQQFLFYPEGRALQQNWVFSSSPLEGWWINIKNGLTTFNRPLHDLGYIYPNYHHGFVDPLTGILLWIGITIVLWRGIKHSIRSADLLCLIGFSSLYFSFAFLITKAPNYTRLLVILPFVIYFAGQGASGLAAITTQFLRKKTVFPLLKIGIPTLSLVVVISWNGLIFNDFVRAGQTTGNDVGSTARYILAHQQKKGHSWILVADPIYEYYSWGSPDQWREWFGFFAGPLQTTRIISPDEVNTLNINQPYTILLSKKAWEHIHNEYTERHPNFRLNNITPDGNFLAIE